MFWFAAKFGLVPDADEVVTETFGDLVGLTGNDGCHVGADEYRLVGLDCYQAVGLPNFRSEETAYRKSAACLEQDWRFKRWMKEGNWEDWLHLRPAFRRWSLV